MVALTLSDIKTSHTSTLEQCTSMSFSEMRWLQRASTALLPLSETLAGLVRPDTGTLVNKRTARLRAALECQRVHISHADA